jgi:hypothetical protein
MRMVMAMMPCPQNIYPADYYRVRCGKTVVR